MQKSKIKLWLVVGGFLSLLFFGWFNVGEVLAAESYSGYLEVCPAGCTPNPNSPAPINTDTNKYIRMQLGIPGITYSCTYDQEIWNGTSVGTQKKTCYYVESNLPDFIKKIYNFSIGVIAIIAVMVIMISGLKWIFAAGNPGTIGAARSDMVSAVSGLILALLSYAILNTINPRLTSLQLTNPNPVQTIEQGANWCKDIENRDIKVRFKPVTGPWESPTSNTGWVALKDVQNGKCGQEYEIQNAYNSDGTTLKTCWWDGGCGDKEVCYQYLDTARPFCMNAESLCQSQDDQEGETGVVKEGSVFLMPNRTSGCDKVDKFLTEAGSSYVCAKETVTVGRDSCQIGQELFCPQGYERVGCERSDECSTQRKGYIAAWACNSVSGWVSGSGWHICTNAPNRGAKGINGICCKRIGMEQYKCEDSNTTKY